MKTLDIFLSELANQNVKLWIENGRLRCRYPEGVLSPDIRIQLTERKQEIITFLEQANLEADYKYPPLKTIERDGNLLPLSYAQQRLWLLEKMALSSNAYNMPLTLHLVGKLDYVALKKSLNQIIARHETLRTTFSEINGIPVQIIKPLFELELPIQDLTQLIPSQQTTKLQQLLQQENEQIFNLEVDPPIRAQLYQLGTTEHILQITLHHIASDGWSLTVLPKELSAIYTAIVQDQLSPLPELPIQYADFAVWQRNYLQGETLESQLSYWKQKLQDLTQLQLSTDHPRPPVQTFNGADIQINISAGLTSKVKQLTQKQGTTLFMTLLAAFKVLLSRYSGQEAIAVGSPVANRNRSEIERLIGFFVNSLVLCTDMGGDPSFTEVLNRVKQTALEAYSHQDIPFEKLVEELQPERELSQNPLFQVMFALQQEEILKPSFKLPNLEVGWYERGGAEMTVRFDLELHLWSVGEEIKGFCAYNRDLFEAETIQRMLSHYQNLLTAVVENPSQSISLLPLMSDTEQQQLLVAWNNTKTDYPNDQCIHQLFEEQVQRTPNAIAVVFEQQKLTYSELNSKANQLAHYLQKLGVVPETLVGICVERSVEMVVGLLAILKAGGAYVPLDPSYPTSRLAQILEDGELHLLLTDSNSEFHLPETPTPAIHINQANTVAIQANVISNVNPQNLAYVLYTSGSTGRPKGVAIEHRSPVSLLHWAREVYSQEELSGVLASTSICFDLSVFELFVPLSWGGKVILAENALHLPELPAAGEVSLINTVPSAARELVRNQSIPTEVKTINLAGEPLDNQLVQQLYKQQTIKAVYNLYGPSEDTTYSTFTLMEKGATNPPTIGRPIANTEVYILDSHLQPVPVGVPGELHIAGKGLARGYLNQPQLTTEKFIPHPFREQPDARLYKTGDLARYCCDGQIEFLGRIDHQVKIRGYRIETGEIEAVLNQNPAVKETVVVAREDNPGNKRLFAYIVPETDTLTSSNLELSDNQVDSWQEIFNQQIDSQLSEVIDPLFNISGWHSSYDNAPIPEEQMRVWAQDIVTQVLANKPQRIWEVGCGTGMLLFQIAPYTQAYYGTDISNISLEYIKKQIAQQPEKYAHVSLAQKRAEDMVDIPDHNFDVVILNSIVQYFPNVEYLLQVIENSIRVIKPGGMIFLGDIRSLPLMKSFHTSVQLYQSTPSLSLQQLKQHIDKQMQQDTELLVSPELFVALKEKHPEISYVQIRLQRGSDRNELNKYRYNVLLHIKAKPASVIEATVESGAGMSSEGIEAYLQQKQPESICFSGIVNGRVTNDVRSVELLSQVEGIKNVLQLRQKLESESVNGIDPERLHQLSSNLGYELELCWSSLGDGELMDAIFVRSELAAEGMVLTPLTQQSVVGGNWHRYGNNPLASIIAKQLIPQLREYLEQRLPEYLLPNGYVVLPQLPLTPNGKVDRKALPAPDLTSNLSTEFVAPETTTQKALAEIWAEVLGIEQVGIHDNFFALGGHSLMATQVVSRLRQAFSIDLPLQNLFEKPDITSLAKELESYLAQTQSMEIAAIQPREQDGNPPPLSFAQQRLWFIEKTGLGGNAYNQPLTLHLVGELDEVALQQSLNQIIARHETLRTTFSLINDTTVQVIRPPFELELAKQDLSGLTPSQQKTQLQQLLQQESEQQFNLEVDPPIRGQLLKLGTTEQILQITLHHIASDGWSLTVFAQELSAHYTAVVQKQPSPLPSLPIQYADFAVWQRNYLQGQTLQTQLDYWKQKLKELPQLQLPTDHPRPAVESFKGAGLPINLSAPLSSKLTQLSQQQGVTLFMTLLAAFKVLLYRYSAQEQIAVGSPIANRNRKEIEGLIGFFVNSLVMYTDLGGQPNFTEVLNRVRQTALEAYSNQDLPFEKLVEELQPERSLSQHPLFQVMFAVQQSEVAQPSFSLPNLEVGWYQGAGAEMTVRLDLELHLWQQGEEIRGLCTYNQDLFEAETINRMLSHYQVLLSAVVDNPEQPISQLSLMSPTEQQQLLVAWNNTKTDYPADQCIHELFEAQVKKTPDAVAVVFEEQQLTYSQLNSKANQLANYLQQLGVGPEVLVGICVERSLEMIIGLLAILKAGGVYVPLDPGYPSERINYMLADSQASVLLTQKQLLDKLLEHQAQSNSSLNRQQIICLDADWGEISQENHHNVDSGVTSDNLAYVIYTSGSTGKPKGVQIYHRSLTNFLKSMSQAPGITNSDTLLAVTSICFDIAALELYLPLIVGAQVVIVSRELATDGRQLLSALDHSGATIIQATPATWQMLLTVGWEASSHSLSSRRQAKNLKILCGGEALPHKLANQLLDRGTELWNMYGPTETTIWSSICHVTPSATTNNVTAANVSYSLGKPIANTQIYILDSYLQPVPIGLPGELHIGGEGLAQGYLNQPELTAEKFIPHPFSKQPNARLYKTGDLARYLPDGQIEFLGRIDNQVKIRGFRIETGEIEAILNQNPTVKETVVVAREDNSEDKRLVAYIVPYQHYESTQDSPLIPQVRQLLKEKLPEYMIPAAFVLLETFPLTPNGKIDRRALPVPEITPSSLSTAYVIPQTETQQQIANIWREVLKVEKVGIYDNFFELGGHSLLLLKVHTRLPEISAQKTSIVELFQYPTISALSQHLIELERKQITDTKITDQAKIRSARKTSIKQQRLQRQQHRKNK
ncbi:MAG: amino acid adenylation domain-containing protein [Symploca sp. SIO2E6]|nr:amino acid adenylation domain-containing protein [Symploca sp. SIO2E6]